MTCMDHQSVQAPPPGPWWHPTWSVGISPPGPWASPHLVRGHFPLGPWASPHSGVSLLPPPGSVSQCLCSVTSRLSLAGPAHPPRSSPTLARGIPTRCHLLGSQSRAEREESPPGPRALSRPPKTAACYNAGSPDCQLILTLLARLQFQHTVPLLGSRDAAPSFPPHLECLLCAGYGGTC